MYSLLAHEARINRDDEKVEEKAFQMKGKSSFKKTKNSKVREFGRRTFRGRVM